MYVHGLRLLVALVTFGFGVAASWLLGSGEPVSCERRVAVSRAPAPFLVPQSELPPPPPPRACDAYRRTVVAVQGGILNGKAVSKPAPAYPAAAKSAGVSGTVAVKIEVDEGGAVTEAEAVSGPLMLREAAEEAALQARLSPTYLGGRPAKVSGVFTYNFVLR